MVHLARHGPGLALRTGATWKKSSKVQTGGGERRSATSGEGPSTTETPKEKNIVITAAGGVPTTSLVVSTGHAACTTEKI